MLTASQEEANVPAEAKLNKMPGTQFLLVYLDGNGQIRLESSGPIADSCNAVLSMKVIDAFLRAIQMSREICIPNYQEKSLFHSSIAIQTYSGAKLANHRPMRQPITEAANFQPVYNQPSPLSPSKVSKYQWQGISNETHRVLSDKKVAISVKDHEFLTLYYEKAFENIQQTNCRTLAKAYVKLVEPQKQVNYPYNGRKVIAGTKSQLDPNETKPPWWPSRVTHREPDHLPKFDEQKMAWISHANFPGSLEAVGQTSDVINSGSLHTLFTRDIKASDHSASSWSNHALRFKTENENINHTISPSSASEDGSPVAARPLKRKLKVAEVHSAARPKSSLIPTSHSFPPTLTNQLSLVDYYDPAFLLQPLKVPEPSHSIASIPNQSSQHQETCDIYLQNPAFDTSAQYWPTLDPICHPAHNITAPQYHPSSPDLRFNMRFPSMPIDGMAAPSTPVCSLPNPIGPKAESPHNPTRSFRLA
ncbi:unnamed protein product [Penicillium pancosmium]